MKKIIVVFLSICLVLGSCAGAFAAPKEGMIRGGGSRADQGSASVKNRAARQGRASSAYGDDAYLLQLLLDFMREYENPEDQLGMWLADAYENGLFSEVDSPEKGYWLEETADDVEKLSAEGQERLLPWAKENAEEQIIHKEEGEIVQKEEIPESIAGVEVLENELRRTVIKDAIKRYKTDASRCSFPFLPINPPDGFFERNVDNSVEYLRNRRSECEFLERISFEFLELLLTYMLPKIENFIMLFPYWLRTRINLAYCSGLKLGYNALMGSKQRFKYKLNG